VIDAVGSVVVEGVLMLRTGTSHALVFDSKAQVVEPSTLLRKRPLIVQRTLRGHPGPSAAEATQAARQRLLCLSAITHGRFSRALRRVMMSRPQKNIVDTTSQSAPIGDVNAASE
jgi:hypothetical protein